MVDIPNHEDPLRELSKTSLVNNVTLILCWSAAEAARYLELYKSYENASFTAIKGQQSTNYSDKLIDFVTVPRSLNKSDAVALIANFGSLKNAVNADQEQLGMISGWGGTKVKRWSSAVGEPFRAKKAAKRGVNDAGRDPGRAALLNQAIPVSRVPLKESSSSGAMLQGSAGKTSSATPNTNASKAGQFQFADDMDDDDDEEAMLAAAIEESKRMSQPASAAQKSSQAGNDDDLSGGVAAALAKLRDGAS
jgi:DNA excision repair protein ERCC-1